MIGSHAINQLGGASDDVNNLSLQDRSQTDILRRTGDFSILFSHGPNLGNDRSTAVDSQAHPTHKLAGMLHEKFAASRSHKETTSGSVGLRVVAQPKPQPSQNAINYIHLTCPACSWETSLPSHAATLIHISALCSPKSTKEKFQNCALQLSHNARKSSVDN
jgi:hypothetical protein